MKKITLMITLLFLLLFPVTVFALESPDIVFTKNTDGKYIYCNNAEFINRDDLADTSNPNPKYLMTNKDLTADKYAMFISHVNHTEIDNGTLWNIVEPGFDIQLDVLFKAAEDTTIVINSLGFEVPENQTYWQNGKQYSSEEPWGCFNAWSSYLNMPIRQLNSGTSYSPTEFAPLTLTIKAGEQKWLSRYIPNYAEVPFYRPVHLMADFEILSGKCDVNIAALKSTGTLGDRSNFADDVAFGSYERDRQYKGIADSLNEVSAELKYTIDDYVGTGTALPVSIHNQYVDGNVCNYWFTNLNPRGDTWANNVCTESDMMEFNYYDPTKKNYYGSKVADADKDDYWHFDVFHNDTSDYVDFGKNTSNEYTFIPNNEMSLDDDPKYACNLGNYGVIYNYKISVNNTGDMIRYINYKLTTTSSNIVILCDENGNPVEPYALCKGERTANVEDVMACVELPAKKTTTFVLKVILTTNYNGGMGNAITITDTPTIVNTYTSAAQKITKDTNYTGKEFYMWKNQNLYISDDNATWEEVKLSDDVKDIFKNEWNSYKILYTGSGYMVKAGMYDGVPYYGARDYYKTVYFLDNNFKLIGSHKFNLYPSAFAVTNNGTYIVKAGTPFYSTNRSSWNYFKYDNLPCYNYGKFSAVMSDKSVMLSADGTNFKKVNYQDFSPKFIDSVGDLYYYADNDMLYVSKDGLYWKTIKAKEPISHISKTSDYIIINNDKRYAIPDFEDNIAIMLNDEFVVPASAPFAEDGTTLVPLRFLTEALDASLKWKNGLITIKKDDTVIKLQTYSDTAFVNGSMMMLSHVPVVENDTAYVPIRFISEVFGLNVAWDENNQLITLTDKK